MSDCFPLEDPHSLFQGAREKLEIFVVWMVRAPQYKSRIGSELNKTCAHTCPSSWRLNEEAGLERQHQFKQMCKGPFSPGNPFPKIACTWWGTYIIRRNRREKKNLSVCYLFCIWLLLDCYFQKLSTVGSLGFQEGSGNFIADVKWDQNDTDVKCFFYNPVPSVQSVSLFSLIFLWVLIEQEGENTT